MTEQLDKLDAIILLVAAGDAEAIRRAKGFLRDMLDQGDAQTIVAMLGGVRHEYAVNAAMMEGREIIKRREEAERN